MWARIDTQIDAQIEERLTMIPRLTNRWLRMNPTVRSHFDRFGGEGLAIFALALIRLAICCYRAAHQSLSIDEAFSYHNYIGGPWSNIASQYYANNHVLFSILAKLSIRTFGTSEFSLRLPTLVAGFAFILGAGWLLRLTISSRPIRWVTLVALSLNPLILDFSVAARGYGLAFALLIWAIYFSVRRQYILCGSLLGLAIATNLTMAFPAVSLALTAAILDKDRLSDRLRVLFELMIPAAIIAIAICYLPLRSALPSHFETGQPSIWQSLFSLIYPGVEPTVGGFLDQGPRVIAGMFLLGGIVVLVVIQGVKEFLRNDQDLRRLIPASVLLLSILIIVDFHHLFSMLYPTDRTGLYLDVLFICALGIAADGARHGGLRAFNVVTLLLLTAQSAAQFHADHFLLWKFDMESKQIAQILMKAVDGKDTQSVTVSATAFNQPALEFYRQYYNIRALRPIVWKYPTLISDADFYVLSGADVRFARTLQLRPIYSAPRAGIVLAADPDTSLKTTLSAQQHDERLLRPNLGSER
jgi:hypothetical protein